MAVCYQGLTIGKAGLLLMSKYTTELRYIIDSGFDLGLSASDYDIFDEGYRETLNKKILDHYYFHEIGFETTERFKFELNRKMREIMVYYNQLYNSLIEINPLINFKKTTSINIDIEDTENESLTVTGSRNDSVNNQNTNNRTVDRQSTGAQTVNNNATNTEFDKIRNVESDTPTNELLSGDISADYYASKVVVNEANRTSAQDTSQDVSENKDESTTEENTQTQVQTTESDLSSNNDKTNVKNSTQTQRINDEGVTISESELLVRYRETFLNIDVKIIKDLRSLFMLIL